MNKKVAVLGLGRSGTKAIYTVFQEMMIDGCQNGTSFVYEPFLWDRDSFDGRFNDVKHRFLTMDGISFEGIHNHLMLPLFIKKPVPWKSNLFVNELFRPSGMNQNVLLKFIRANGRIRLLKEICPELQFIFVIRNPLDTIHSILSRFSYFGGEFHKDDYPRFINEIQENFHVSVADDNLSVAKRELLFWYYMNRYALETFRDEGIEVIRICLESYVCNPGVYFEQFKSVLDCNCENVSHSLSQRRVGVITENYEIAKEDFEIIMPYLEMYPSFLKEFNMEYDVDLDSIIAKYKIRTDLTGRMRCFYGYTPIRLARQLEKMIKGADKKQGSYFKN